MRDVPFHPQISPLSEHCSLVGPPWVPRQNQGCEGTFCGSHLEYVLDYWFLMNESDLLSSDHEKIHVDLYTITTSTYDLNTYFLLIFNNSVNTVNTSLPFHVHPSNGYFV